MRRRFEKPPQPVALVHYCCADGCARWGSFGYGVNILSGRRGQWFCEDHRPPIETEPAAPIPSPALPRPVRQGSLL